AGAPDIGRVFHPLQREGRGPILVAGIPLAFSDSDICQPNKPGRIGQHTPEALRDWLNLSDDEIRSLEDEGALR
ncbi:MAG TPA: hypothetical protein VKU60_10905, partial [Chloroflexota bacterium]|nr:hypothetical protein [Chloroflexota bacterium]